MSGQIAEHWRSKSDSAQSRRAEKPAMPVGMASTDARQPLAALWRVPILSEEWLAEQARKAAPDIGPVYAKPASTSSCTAFGRLDPPLG
jgi:hypothetical protein